MEEEAEGDGRGGGVAAEESGMEVIEGEERGWGAWMGQFHSPCMEDCGDRALDLEDGLPVGLGCMAALELGIA